MGAVGEVGLQRILDDAGLAIAVRKIVTDGALTAADRADAFAMLLQAAGLGFNGSVELPPDQGYADVFATRISKLRTLQTALRDAGADVAGLVDAVKRSHARNSIRSGSALLLAAAVDAQAASATVSALLDAPRLSRAQVPPLALHRAAQAAALVNNAEVAAKLAALLPAVPLEEGREDVLCALVSIERSPESRQAVADFVRTSAAGEFDSAGQTGLILLRRGMDPAEFVGLLESLIAAAPNASRRTALEAFRDGEPPRGGIQEPPGSAPGQPRVLYKQWDGFHVTLYDDGARIQWGDTFSDFLSY